MSKYYVEALNIDGRGESGFVATGYLTTEHSASSDGIPVFVTRAGQVFSAADLPADVSLRLSLDEASEWRPMAQREEIAVLARRAGYRVYL